MSQGRCQSLYIHLPFCLTICPYCDFPKLLYAERFIKPYLETLVAELKSLKINHKLKTIYIGGGTPSALKEEDLTYLFENLKAYLTKNTEFSVECNPENLTASKIQLFKKYHVNRLSIGVQTFQPLVAKKYGRHSSYYDLFNLIIRLRKAGFKNINLDFIYGFKEQTLSDVISDVRLALSLNVEHLSFYSLIIDQGSILYNLKEQEISDDLSRQYFDIVEDILLKNHYRHYEVSNYAQKQKYYARHNLVYWKDQEYYAIGLGAASYYACRRNKNTLSLKKYLARSFLGESEEITLKEDQNYFLITNLRLYEGFSLKAYQKKFHVSFLKEKEHVLKELFLEGLLLKKGDKIKASKKGMPLLDIILLKLID